MQGIFLNYGILESVGFNCVIAGVGVSVGISRYLLGLCRVLILGFLRVLVASCSHRSETRNLCHKQPTSRGLFQYFRIIKAPVVIRQALNPIRVSEAALQLSREQQLNKIPLSPIRHVKASLKAV